MIITMNSINLADIGLVLKVQFMLFLQKESGHLVARACDGVDVNINGILLC